MRHALTLFCCLLVITSHAQNVGIGTLSPVARLDLHGKLGMNDSAILLRVGTDLNHGLKYDPVLDGPFLFGYTGGSLGTAGGPTHALEWDAYGNVGILSNLTLDSAGTNTGTVNHSLRFGATASGEGIGSNRLSSGTNYNGLDIYTSAIKRISITNGGNVGFGTATPTANIELGGSLNPTIYLHSSANTNGLGGVVLFSENDSNFSSRIRHNTNPTAGNVEGLFFERRSGGTYTSTLVIDQQTGNIGIGTLLPSSTLHINGSVRFQGYNNGFLTTDALGNLNSNVSYGGNGSASSIARSDHTHIGQSWFRSSGTGLDLTDNDVDGIGLFSHSTGTSFSAAALAGEITATSGVSVGVYGATHSNDVNAAGVFGQVTVTGNAKAVWGFAGGNNTVGIYGQSVDAGSKAGLFDGNVQVNGTLSKTAGSFKIDHLLDPQNKNLYHSFVESPDMMNVYDGNITLDYNGEATITLPDWFEALNKDFRYQLTAIGKPSPNLYIAQKINGNKFAIAGGAPNGEVSWMVTGIRHDKYADEHRIPVEEVKTDEEKANYGKPLKIVERHPG